MTEEQLLELAANEGFYAAVMDPQDIPVEGKFRVFCEENLCGKYNANYSCPPDCGTVEQMHNAILREEKTLILESIWDIAGYEDKVTIQKAKMDHMHAAIRLLNVLRKNGYEGFASGYNGCPFCDPCKKVEGKPCPFPEKRVSCLSAYCVNVAELTERCGMEFAWTPERLYLIGMIAFHKKKSDVARNS